MNKRGELIEVAGVLMIIFLVLLVIGYNVLYALTSGSEDIIIKEKWMKYKGNDAKYLVSSENGQVFQITDTWIKWRFDSSNLYSNIEEGQECNIKTQGWRFPLLSDYKNILETDCKFVKEGLGEVEEGQ